MPEITNTCPPGCPGCYFPKQSYEKTLSQKAEKTSLIFTKTGLDVTGIESPLEDIRTNYRRKAVLHTEYRNGCWHFGLMKNDEVLDVAECAIHSNIINKSAGIFKRYLSEFPGFPLKYYVHSGKQIALVLKTNERQNLNWINDDLKNELERAGSEGLWVHYNASAGKRIFLKDKLEFIWGKEISSDENGLLYGPLSFTQQIRQLADSALNLSLDFFTENKNSDTVVDLYSGTGAGLKLFTNSGFRCIGIELSGEAVRMAALNVPGAFVLRGKCHQRIPQIELFLGNEKLKSSKWNLFLNPPRTGIDKDLLKWICNTKPERIAYLSCSPHTLARDLTVLLPSGYETVLLKPYDFFPHTRHVETLALITRDK